MKYEWRKEEKNIYLPPKKPVLVDVPQFNYCTISGSGNPDSPFFAECVDALYAVSYAIRMSHKKGLQPENFYEYTVYPLEGVWDLSEKAKRSFDGAVNKDELVFTLMIRQPNFVSSEFAEMAKAWAMKKKPHLPIQAIAFRQISEGKCIQMMHLGSYDNEPESFALMDDFARNNQLKRKSMKHKEIYISDPRKVVPEKLKTVLRFKVE
ncbi:MAG: hypothetical protein CSA50_00420 [Gammaproteobacteria bacterium]|nr:MAG: hypothetical protein CSA50_00420 [Gammaproteobacteria bacterium]